MQFDWNNTKEIGSIWGLRLCFFILKLFGRLACKVVVVPAVIYFFVSNTQARQSSKDYLLRISNLNKTNGSSSKSGVTNLMSFRHFMSFADCLIDKLLVWMDKLKVDVRVSGIEQLKHSIASGKGAVMLGSHVGNVEVSRYLAESEPGIKINVLMHVEHSQNFFSVLSETSQQAANIIPVSSFNPILAMQLKQKLDNGELLLLAGDRVSASTNERTISADFLSDTAYFPEGPFILAALLKCPVYLVFAMKDELGYEVSFQHFCEDVDFKRQTRQAQLQKMVQKYADSLQIICKKYPLQWYNFFNFWKIPKGSE